MYLSYTYLFIFTLQIHKPAPFSHSILHMRNQQWTTTLLLLLVCISPHLAMMLLRQQILYICIEGMNHIHLVLLKTVVSSMKLMTSYFSAYPAKTRRNIIISFLQHFLKTWHIWKFSIKVAIHNNRGEVSTETKIN